MTDTALNKETFETAATAGETPSAAPKTEPAANNHIAEATETQAAAPLKATKAKPLTSSDYGKIAREKAAAGKFPPLEDVLKVLRYKHLMDNEVPDEQSGNFEAPEYYDWADLLPYVQRETGQSAKDLMENTLAGFPSATTIHHAERQFAEKYKRYPIMEDGAILAPGNLRWTVLQAVEKQIMSGIKAPPKGAEKESELISEIRRYKLSADVIMMDQKMGAGVKKAIEAHRQTISVIAGAQRRLDSERAAKALEAETYRRKDMTPAQLQAETERNRRLGITPAPKASNKPAPAPAKPAALASQKAKAQTIQPTINIPTPRKKEFQIEALANVVRTFVREHKRPPVQGDFKTRVAFGPDQEIAIEHVHEAFDDQNVEGGEWVYSLADFKERIGLINKVQYKDYFDVSQPIAPVSARAVYDTLLAIAQTGQNLNFTSTPNGRKAMIGAHKAAYITIALQHGAIEGWDDLAKHLGLPEGTPAPICLYDFMVETKLAIRNHNYELKNPVSPPPKPNDRIIEVLKAKNDAQKPEPTQPKPDGEEQKSPPKQKTQPKPPQIRYEFNAIVAGLVAVTRELKGPPLASDKLHKIDVGGKKVRIEAINIALKSGSVDGAGTMRSVTDIKTRYGYRHPYQILPAQREPLEKISAKAAFEMVSGYIAVKKALPNLETNEACGEVIGEYEGRAVSVIQLSLAFQSGVVTGWDTITKDCPDIALEGDVPVPTCLYEFLTACKFARRRDDLSLEIFPIHAEDLDALLDDVLGEDPADDDPSEEEPAEPAF